MSKLNDFKRNTLKIMYFCKIEKYVNFIQEMRKRKKKERRRNDVKFLQ
jgi:hypothetical protein